MRTIEHTNTFLRDYKREKKGPYRHEVELLLFSAVLLLGDDKPLPDRNHDHRLAGDWKDFRECHLKPDLLLIYRKPSPTALQLVRLGSHSELFG